jgi:hypothetical protein
MFAQALEQGLELRLLFESQEICYPYMHCQYGGPLKSRVRHQAPEPDPGTLDAPGPAPGP